MAVVASAVADAVGGGALGTILGGAAAGAAVGGITSAISGGNIINGIVNGGVGGAVAGSVFSGISALASTANAAQAGVSLTDGEASALQTAQTAGGVSNLPPQLQAAANSALQKYAAKGINALTGAGVAGTALGGIVAANAASQSASTIAGGAVAAANVLAPAATAAANIQAGAATQSANTLATGATTAAAQQVAGETNALGTANSVLGTQTTNQQPYMKAGTDALATLAAGLAPGGQFNKPFTMADATNSEAYKFALAQGTQALNNTDAAKNGTLNSNNIQDNITFAEGTASTYEQQAFNQWLQANNLTLGALQSQVASGQLSTAQLQTALAQYGVSSETINQNIGTSNAAGTTGAANATAAGEVGAAKYTAAGITGAANATAAGLTGQANAIGAGQAQVGNIATQTMSDIGNQLSTAGSLAMPTPTAVPNTTNTIPMGGQVNNSTTTNDLITNPNGTPNSSGVLIPTP
jgi:hypothetical protein